MKNKILIFSLSFILGLSIFEFVPSYADVNDYATIISYKISDDSSAYLVAFNTTPSLYWNANYLNWYIGNDFAGYQQPPRNLTTIYEANEYYLEMYPNNYFSYTGWSSGFGWNPNYETIQITILKGVINDWQDLPSVEIINAVEDPDTPEPGSSWLEDMWEWFLWQLGINDDYSGDIDAYITGGDRERMEYVTPSPSPTPTPYPSPTPYDLTINYPDGTTGTITGIPGSTTIINGGDTTNNYGSDFDIFAVDVQIGDGGSSNPKDGLNSVMDASNDYLKDVDISPVQNSFSIIPNDWFLLIGVLAALPFIAGFIMRLLK